MRAVAAILLDAYRELSSRKIFWITLLLSLSLVIGYACIGFTETGMSFLFGLYTVESEFFNIDSPLSSVLYRGLFVSLIVGIWLAWAATILALISTASIFPDLVARGSIDMILSKPVSRFTIFFAKYAAGLLFALLQVSIVCVGVFLAMGWRLGEWEWMIFLAIPVVVIFFSYLFCISAVMGIITRSAMTALLVAILFWFMLFSIQTTESMLLSFKLDSQVAMERQEEAAERTRAAIDSIMADEEAAENQATRLARLNVDLEIEEEAAAENRRAVEAIAPWHRRIELLLTPLPKTGQTIGLLDRWLVREGDMGMQDVMSGNFRRDQEGNIVPRYEEETEAMRRLTEKYDSKSLWSVIGSSLLFEMFILGIGAWIFLRRDF
ncbi:MAG: hypothetical protein EA377_07725 [Phycisphaerales bacterium]|nr:MAG: hypothetical protein EA377_07725 [Phycisphaerales bacterium]